MKIIELTAEQILALEEEVNKLNAMEDAGEPGMMIGQIFYDRAIVGVIEHKRSLAIQAALNPKSVGRTARTVCESIANYTAEEER